MSGPKPKPTALRMIQGGAKTSHKAINEAEPKPTIPPELPAPPDYLNEVAQTAWRSIAPHLYTVGLLTDLDIHTFARWCAAFAEWRRAMDMIARYGDVVRLRRTAKRKEKGKKADEPDDPADYYLMPSPYVAIRDKADAKMHKCEDAMGMNPATRSRIQVNRGDEADKFEAFLRKRG